MRALVVALPVSVVAGWLIVTVMMARFRTAVVVVVVLMASMAAVTAPVVAIGGHGGAGEAAQCAAQQRAVSTTQLGAQVAAHSAADGATHQCALGQPAVGHRHARNQQGQPQKSCSNTFHVGTPLSGHVRPVCRGFAEPGLNEAAHA